MLHHAMRCYDVVAQARFMVGFGVCGLRSARYAGCRPIRPLRRRRRPGVPVFGLRRELPGATYLGSRVFVDLWIPLDLTLTFAEARSPQDVYLS